MGRRWLIWIISVGAACLAMSTLISAGAGASTTVSVRVTISGLRTPRNMRLRIVRNGRTVYDQRVRSRLCPGGCRAADLLPRRSPLFEGDLQGRGDLDVVLGLYTGGAHCCFVDQVFSYDRASGAYVQTEHDFLDAGAAIELLNGRYVFRSADARIAEDGLTDYADSGAPLQIWRFTGGRFLDVSRSYPALVRADAARWLTAFTRHVGNGVGFIAAWAADEDLLGNAKQVSATLASEARRHRLHSALGLPHNSETAFVADLKQLLRQLGYTK